MVWCGQIGCLVEDSHDVMCYCDGSEGEKSLIHVEFELLTFGTLALTLLLKPSWQIDCGIPSGGFLSPCGGGGVTTRPLIILRYTNTTYMYETYTTSLTRMYPLQAIIQKTTRGGDPITEKAPT